MLRTALFFLGASYQAQACSRVTYNASDDRIVVGRSMDFVAETNTTFFAYPAGLKRTGSSVEANGYNWTSKYGSVTALMYGRAHVDGINEKGLTGSCLYLDGSDYGKRNENMPSMWVGHWLQYFLDQYATVEEVARAVCPGGGKSPFQVVATSLVPGVKSVGHLSYSDPSGDNLVMEYVEGALRCYQSTNYTVMTNEPTYDQQLAINSYWAPIAESALPGTSRPADRFVRLSYYLSEIPQTDDLPTAISYAAGMVRAVSVPIPREISAKPGAADIWPTYWRVFTDLRSQTIFYESASGPELFWFSLKDFDLSTKGTTQILDVQASPWEERVGDVSKRFKKATEEQCAEGDTQC
ncbi:hydrolase [Fusarium flagelliforme]|uniref:Penicillin acylase n=1 Tax=Fusarium flagelliforme TaxID=2675880 RepID=A0A395M8J3_9HYPO|nr:hydrolase [Fusarium flagelliforme]KAH7175082.1 hydrolase [Fusarium flagelliforme]RFN44222.1 penicillin acylase [Fusarium flagelliforme]